MRLADYVDQDALGLADLVRRGKISAAELAETAAAACAAVDPEINAVVELWPPEPAPTDAGAPFAGVPFLIKDAMLRMAGRRCESGSRLAAGLVSPHDSTLMARFRAAGLVTIGRTAVPELTCSLATEPLLNGPTRNPWDRGLSTGGSSGGAAAAVAAGIVPIAHANDAGGSIRSPAAWCGLFGLKPSRGRVPVGPDSDEAMFGMAVELAVSRSVRDSAALLDAVEGPASGDPFFIPRPARPYREVAARDPGRLRIGVMPQGLGGERTEPEILAALDRVARDCEALGHDVVPADLDLGLSWEAFMTGNARIWLPTLAAGITALAQATGRPIDETMLEPATLAYYHYGRGVDAIGFQQALAMRNTLSRALGAWFERFDILLSPTMPTAPPAIGVLQPGPDPIDAVAHLAWLFGFTPFTPLINLVGVPAMTMPLAHDEARDLPIGLHFTAGFGREDRLFQLAGQLERALPWRQRRPAIHAGRQQGTRG